MADSVGENQTSSTILDGALGKTLQTTPTNDLMLKYFIDRVPSLSMTTIQTVLDLLNDGRFNSNFLSLRSSQEVFDYSVMRNSIAMKQRSATTYSLPWFPPAVVDNIISIIEAQREPLSSIKVVTSYYGEPPARDLDPARKVLANLSLVHPSWTWPAQKAMGRRLVIAYDSGYQLCKAASNPLFGWWTTSAFISCHEYKKHRVMGGMYEYEDQKEKDKDRIPLIIGLLHRLPNIHTLTVQFEWTVERAKSENWDLLHEVCALKQLRRLTLAKTDSYVKPTDAFFHYLRENLSKLESLESLESLGIDSGRPLNTFESNAHDADVQLGPTKSLSPPQLQEVSLTIHRTTPSDFIAWLFKRDDDGVGYMADAEAKVKSLLTVDLEFKIQQNHTDVLPPFFAALNAGANFGHLSRLTLTLLHDTPESHLPTLFAACTNLRELKLAVERLVTLDILGSISSTLEDFFIENTLTDPDITLQDEHFAEWLLSAHSPASQKSMRTMTVRMQQVIRVRMYSLFDAAAHQNAPPQPQPVLLRPGRESMPRLRDAVNSLKIDLTMYWRRVRRYHDDPIENEGPVAANGAEQNEAPFTIEEVDEPDLALV